MSHQYFLPSLSNDDRLNLVIRETGLIDTYIPVCFQGPTDTDEQENEDGSEMPLLIRFESTIRRRNKHIENFVSMSVIKTWTQSAHPSA